MKQSDSVGGCTKKEKAIPYWLDDSALPIVRITSCSDPLKWYASHVGKNFTVLADIGNEYKTVTPSGYINFILKEDAEVMYG